MLRRESWTVIFQRKKSPSYDYKFPSLEEIEKQFEDAERDRSNVFESSQRQLEFDFLEAEAARRLPEEQREQEFDQFLCRERVFQSNEVRRGGVFEQKQGVREWDFNKSHEERDKQAKWFLQLIEQLFSKGHAYCEEIYNRMVDSLSAEFLNMLRSAQETFIFAQTKRNNVLKKMVKSSKSRMTTLESHSPFSDRGRALVSPSDKTETSPKPTMIPSPSRSPSILYRPSTIGSDGPWIPAAPTTVIQTSARPASPSSSALRPIRIAPRPEVVKNETDDSRGASSSASRRRALRDLLAFYSALLHEKEEKRAVLFKSALNSHDSTFKRAEAQRALTTGRRDSRFNEAEFSLESQFNSSQGAFRDQFDSREQVRNGVEDHRDQLFEDAQSRFELIFGQQQSSHSRRVGAACATEKRFAASCKSRVKNLLLGMEQMVRDIREKHRRLFTEACSGYQGEPAPQHTIPELVSSPQMIAPVSHHSHQDYIRVTTSHSPSFDNLRAPNVHLIQPVMVTPPDRAPDPESMFAPKTLFKANGWSAGLPLPQTEDVQKQHIYSSSTIEEHLKMHQAFFKKKEARRHKEAEHALQRWQQIFTINELKRQDEFKTQQKRCHDAVVQRQVTQPSQFWTEQQEREEEFQRNESERERLFWTQEEKRVSDFKSSQESRDTQFHKQQESLLTKAQLQETQREDDFSGWEISMQGKFWGMVMKWRNGFANDELKMERTFKKIAQSADA
ncbi:unnamed protein product [Somion occarium]|uniref:Uncharacterized protein n=1 Tax=Somion occarium TaxID=3059160 RepID=A0ABP1DM47_9APHY